MVDVFGEDLREALLFTDTYSVEQSATSNENLKSTFMYNFYIASYREIENAFWNYLGLISALLLYYYYY